MDQADRLGSGSPPRNQVAVPAANCVAAGVRLDHLLNGKTWHELAALLTVALEAADHGKLAALCALPGEEGLTSGMSRESSLRQAHALVWRLQQAGELVALPGSRAWNARTSSGASRCSARTSSRKRRGGVMDTLPATRKEHAMTETPEQMLREFHASKQVHGGLMPGDTDRRTSWTGWWRADGVPG